MKSSLKPKLVVTSPPYPAVYILYHRWQVFGRKETPAPYWLTNMNDGETASYYTLGSRGTALGLENYFRNIEDSFRSIRKVIARSAIVVQIVAFSDAESQLPLYLAAMERAGFVEFDELASTGKNRVSVQPEVRVLLRKFRNEIVDLIRGELSDVSAFASRWVESFLKSAFRSPRSGLLQGVAEYRDVFTCHPDRALFHGSTALGITNEPNSD
jgi:hypothetical protein